MNNSGKTEPASTITSPDTMKAVEQLTAIDSEELRGIHTALSVIAPRLKALNEAVVAGKNTEATLEKYRKDLAAQRAASPMFEAMIKSHPEIIAAEEAKIVESTRKAVTVEIESLSAQLSTINQHLLTTRQKYGNMPTTVKQEINGRGTVTDGNRAEIETALLSRGYTNVNFSPIGGGHYQVSGVSSAGRARTGKHGSQIIRDWM